MTSHTVRRWITVGALLALPVMAHAQEATLSGTVSDATGGALPGVTVRAVHEASGNSFEAVTDERGDYRIPARVGVYRLIAELAGFAPVSRSVTLLVGQQAVVNLQLALSGVQESVTVTGEAPLLDITQSSLGGNIDPRQLQELPVQGRNWMDLVMLAPGARVNAVSDNPSNAGTGVPGGARTGGDFQLNIDGQQVTNLLGEGSPQARFSKDTIAEFEFLASRFDATQGRASGLQVNAITKSGTNTPSGTFSGYFRHDRFNAADHVAKRVLPYQNQQLSGTFGGPIRKDRVHFFVNYEYEREPRTAVWTTPYPHFNLDLSDNRTEKKGGGRLDAQFSPRTRLVARAAMWRSVIPDSGSATGDPAGSGDQINRTTTFLATLTQVPSNRAVNEVKVGYSKIFEDNTILLKNPRARFFGSNGPTIELQGITAGGNENYPETQHQDVYSVRDDFTYSFTRGGRHTMKAGGEYLRQIFDDFRCKFCEGTLEATLGPIPVPVETLFPNLFDASTWNLRPLSPISIRWRQAFGPVGANIPRNTFALWLQDDWTVLPRLTLNLGVRYDLETNTFNNDVKQLPFLTGSRPDDTNNVGPRLGFSWSVNDRSVVRGGYGVYYGTVRSTHFANFYENGIIVATPNDGRPDFASNPWNGPTPTFEALQGRLCTAAAPFAPGCIRDEIPPGGVVFARNKMMPYSHQASIGVQRQVGAGMGIDVDYIYIGTRDAPRDLPINITYNPATGANYPFSDLSRRPFPEWGYVNLAVNGYRANSHALQTAFTRRFRNRWQANGTYTLSILRDAYPRPVEGLDLKPVPFPTEPDLGGEYGLAVTDQRHRATINGIWELPYGLQLSGLYFYGSGERRATSWGTDLRQLGGLRPNELRLRPDGTIVPRNNLVGDPIHRVDLRIQGRIPLAGRSGIDGTLEVFNVFNHANYGSYTTREDNRNYGQPSQNNNVAYAPRILQLGFRFAF